MAGPSAAVAGKSMRSWVVSAVLLAITLGGGYLLPQLMPHAAPKAEPAAAPTSSNSYSYAPPQWPEAPDHQAMFLRLILGTVLVLGLCVATMWACKRWLHSTAFPHGACSRRSPMRSMR